MVTELWEYPCTAPANIANAYSTEAQPPQMVDFNSMHFIFSEAIIQPVSNSVSDIVLPLALPSVHNAQTFGNQGGVLGLLNDVAAQMPVDGHGELAAALSHLADWHLMQ